MKKSDAIVLGPKPTKACVNCRRLKMKCEVDGTPPCRRCRHADAACVFKPRSNAAAAHEIVSLSEGGQCTTLLSHLAQSDPTAGSVLNRLDRIEAILGIQKGRYAVGTVGVDSDQDEEASMPNSELSKAVRHLRLITRPPQNNSLWSYSTVKGLWETFLNNLPLLHFLKDQRAFSSPSPLLLASVLYISALHNPTKELASLAREYFVATCDAITELVIPIPQPNALGGFKSNPAGRNHLSCKDEDKTFQNILGLILASLVSEAYIGTTDKWIAIAYRLLLDSCPTDLNDMTQDWCGLLSGIQVIDIEHASMHMCHPLLPRQPPTPSLQQLNSHEGDAYRGLTQIMHQGLSHFVGRCLPTIWSFVSSTGIDSTSHVRTPFTDEDSRVIRLWARRLDDWLVRYNGTSQPSPSDRQGILILLQYHLHKLYVLSIYHPARGFDMSSTNITPSERHELLVSARAVLRLRQDDASIWSNWDLIMITWAAMLLLRGVEDGMICQDDLCLIQTHISSLERSDPSVPSIHGVLADRIQSSMQSMHTTPDMSHELSFPPPNVDHSWTIFDQEIMALANPSWLFEGPSVGSTQTELSQHSAMSSARYTDGLTTTSPNSFDPSKQWGPTEQLAGVRMSRFNPTFSHGKATGNDRYLL
ncbi:hypothetical protein BDV38DRAFT_163199 [Aspergillus pseudotamarii]|uniref:Zn(2)-C6 fungal-type domain-containing protein n=1 Tax=Aspergillus pseudotamarii TaxID=132259 RepID=A0A5N6SI21_ASPPS|nr:uncharacterized protein BDV38DRAFT_163199 [Aspergillus pseudotamarii]KAE8134275.1 hypothetical protein BDV38DRAFT_163199 [Aspergillus pseudotamarii]